MNKTFLLAISMATLFSPAYAASFDCKKARVLQKKSKLGKSALVFLWDK
jgi:uncharacterized protein